MASSNYVLSYLTLINIFFSVTTARHCSSVQFLFRRIEWLNVWIIRIGNKYIVIEWRVTKERGEVEQVACCRPRPINFVWLFKNSRWLKLKLFTVARVNVSCYRLVLFTRLSNFSRRRTSKRTGRREILISFTRRMSFRANLCVSFFVWFAD